MVNICTARSFDIIMDGIVTNSECQYFILRTLIRSVQETYYCFGAWSLKWEENTIYFKEAFQGKSGLVYTLVRLCRQLIAYRYTL